MNFFQTMILKYTLLSTCRNVFPLQIEQGFPSGSDDKESACSAGDLDSIPGSGRSPVEGNVNPLQYSCLGNPMDRGAWWASVNGVTESDTAEWLTHFQIEDGYMLITFQPDRHLGFCFLFFVFFIYFYQLEANQFTILQWVLSYIDMNQPWIYMYSPS